MCVCSHVARGVNTSITVNSTCSSNSSSNDPFTATSLPVALSCCVEASCPSWTAQWYRGSANYSSHPTISVNLTEKQETFTCVLTFDVHSDNPYCHDYQKYQDSIKLIRCTF